MAPAPNPPPPQPPGPPAPNQPPAPEAVVLDWLPIGPVGRGDPVWYVDLKGLNCTTQGDAGTATTMLELAPTLCLGLNGDQAAWESGAAALATIPAPTLATSDCWSVAAYDVLQDIAGFRRQNPAVPFTLAPRPGTACPPDLKFLEDDARNSPPAPVCAGAPVVLVGTLEGLPAGSVRSVSVGTAIAAVGFRNSPDDFNYPPGDLYFLAPPIEEAGPVTVSVAVAVADYPVQGTVTLDYADPQACLPPSGTAS